MAADNLRTYPVYHPDREPAGYWERLQRISKTGNADAAKYGRVSRIASERIETRFQVDKE